MMTHKSSLIKIPLLPLLSFPTVSVVSFFYFIYTNSWKIVGHDSVEAFGLVSSLDVW